MCNYCRTQGEARREHRVYSEDTLARMQTWDVEALKNINREQEYEIMDLRKQVHTLKQNALAARLMMIRVTEELNKAAATYGKPLV